MRWQDLSDSGAFGQVCHDRLVAPGVLLVVTTRRDGTARLSPIEPLVLEGELWLCMMWKSAKAADVERDNRVLIHSAVAGPIDPGEVKLRGLAIEELDPGRRLRYRDAVQVLGWQPEEPTFHLFRIDIDDVTLIRYRPNGDQLVARWPARTEVIRRETSATSVGPLEPHPEFFA